MCIKISTGSTNKSLQGYTTKKSAEKKKNDTRVFVKEIQKGTTSREADSQ